LRHGWGRRGASKCGLGSLGLLTAAARLWPFAFTALSHPSAWVPGGSLAGGAARAAAFWRPGVNDAPGGPVVRPARPAGSGVVFAGYACSRMRGRAGGVQPPAWVRPLVDGGARPGQRCQKNPPDAV